jgi:hypothetical protein
MAINRSLISRSSSFTFNSWPLLPQRRGAGRHLIRRANDHRLGGDHPVGQRHAQQLGQGFAFAPRLQIPQRAVNGIARGACRQQPLQLFAGKPASSCSPIAITWAMTDAMLSP